MAALTLRRLAILAVLVATLPSALAQPKKDIKQSEQATRALATWLESDDFEPRRLAPVTKLGQLVVPSLAAALERGPSPAKRELVRRSVAADYEALDRGARPASARPLRSKSDFTRHYLANFDALYRIRAAQALGAIGGPSARKALEGALPKAPRDDVRTVIEQVLKQVP